MRAESFTSKEIQHHNLNKHGYMFKLCNEYGIDSTSNATTNLINRFNFLEIDKSPGSRYRAYLKLHWNRSTNNIVIAEDQKYYQTYLANVMDGGKIREFQILSEEDFKNETLQKIINNNLEFIRQSKELINEENLIFGIHFIRYQASVGKAAYSSPTWLHIDDEPLVFLHLIQISNNIIGGDSIIARKKGEIKNVFKLKNFMDTMIVNRKARHAVTPIGSTDGTATRDIILFTVEPSSTNEGRKL